MNSNKSRYLFASLILVLICFLSIGFSAFQAPLLIDGAKLTVRVEADIRVTGNQLENATEGVISSYEDYNVHSIIAGVYLPKEDSSITYKIEVTNFGNKEMGIFDITNLPSNLTYELKEYTLKDKICDKSNRCTLGAKKEFYITIKYAPNKYDASRLNYSLNLNVDFRGYHKIIYTNIKNTDNYPKEVMDGSNFETTFTSDIPAKVKLTGNTTYTYKSNVLSVTNVTADITVDRVFRFYEKILASNNVTSGCPEQVGNYTRLTSIETGSKFCTALDNYGTSYYFRGAAKNNYVKFAGYYWRIIRVNGDNTVRLIYAGPSGAADATSIIGTSAYNNTRTDNTYVGYMIGTVGANNYAATHSNSQNSALKTTIDNWYKNSSLNQETNKKYLADNLFCNDRTLYQNSDISTVLKVGKRTIDTGRGYGAYGNNITYYAGFYRLIVSAELGKTTKVYQSYASLKCAQKNDSFTVSDNVNGNAKLIYPVATITADEVMLAGALNAIGFVNTNAEGMDTFVNPENKVFYLYNGQSLMTMTPSGQPTYVGAHAMIGTGWVSGGGTANTARGVRPVINIKTDTLIKSGDGTLTNPYIFE